MSAQLWAVGRDSPMIRSPSVEPLLHHRRSALAPPRQYGNKFGDSGFLEFLNTAELSDVAVLSPDGKEHRLHRLILARHSQFFRRLFSSDWREAKDGVVKLGFQDPAGVWPLVLNFMYTDSIKAEELDSDSVMAVMAMARELMIPSLSGYCLQHATTSLDPQNAIKYLSQAVHFNCESFHTACVELVAEHFPLNFTKSTESLPADVVLAVLDHPSLMVQTEEQVLVFVSNYVRRFKQELDSQPEMLRKLWSRIKLQYISNERLAKLAEEDLGVPADLLLAAMAQRLQLIDHPERLPMSGQLAPRVTYLASMEYGIPGGSEYASIPLEAVWDDSLAAQIRLSVQGDQVEGSPESVLRADESSWFMVTSTSSQVHIELEFPDTMRVTELTKFTFSHGMNAQALMNPYGISDHSWFQMRGLVASVSKGDTDPPTYQQLRTTETIHGNLEYTFTVATESAPKHWRRLRITASDEKASSCARLSIRNLRLYGRVEYSLLRPSPGRDLLVSWKRNKAHLGGHSRSKLTAP